MSGKRLALYSALGIKGGRMSAETLALLAILAIGLSDLIIAGVLWIIWGRLS